MNNLGLIFSIIAYTIAALYIGYRAGFKRGFIEAIDACQEIVDTLTEDVKNLGRSTQRAIDDSQKKQEL